MNLVALMKSTILGVALLAVPLFPTFAGEEDDKTTHFGALTGLAGQCWEGVEEKSGDKERRCYEWVFGNKFIREHLTVYVGEKVYSGETLYAWDRRQEMLGFTYWSSDGGLGTGDAVATAYGFDYPEERFDPGDGSELIFQQKLEIIAEDAFAFVMNKKTEEGWIVVRKTVLHLVK